MFGANYFPEHLPSSSGWLTWDKKKETGSDDNADCEYIYTNLQQPARIFRHLWRGHSKDGEENSAPQRSLRQKYPDFYSEYESHPHQKPVALMKWIITEQCALPAGALIVDPYMGSGTTGVVCLRHGYQFIGIESNKHYFDLAVKRLQEEARRREHDIPLWKPPL